MLGCGYPVQGNSCGISWIWIIIIIFILFFIFRGYNGYNQGYGGF